MLFPSSKLASYHIYFLTIQLPFPLAYFQGSLVRTTPEAQIQTFCLAKKSTATPISVTIPTHRSFAIKSTRGNFLTSPMSSTGEIWSSQVRLQPFLPSFYTIISSPYGHSQSIYGCSQSFYGYFVDQLLPLQRMYYGIYRK